MSDQKVRLILEALDKTSPAFKAAARNLSEIKTAASRLVGSFTSLKAAIISAGAAMAFRSVVKQVIDYNAALENSRLGIAAILTSMTELTDAQGNVLHGQEKFAAAGHVAVQAQKELQKIGMTTSATYQELVEVYQGILAPALSAKMTFAETLEITGLLTNAVKAIGLPINQIKQEARDLIQGGIQSASSSLATALNITDAMVKKWREQGTLFTEVKSRLEGFVYASRDFENTWGGTWSNFKDIIQKTMGEGLAGFFESLKGAIQKISSAIVDIKRDADGVITSITVKPAVIDGFRSLAYLLEDMLKTARAIVDLLSKVPGAGILKSIGKSWNAMHQWDEIKKDVPGVDLPKPRQEDLERLTSLGYSPKQIAEAIAAGKIKLGSQTTDWKIPGVWGVVRGAPMDYSEDDLAKWFANSEKGNKIGIKGKPTAGSGEGTDKVKKKNDDIMAQLYKMLGMERELIDMQAQEYATEGIDAKLVARWKEISLLKLQQEEEEKYRQAMEQGAAKEAEAAMDRIEFNERIRDVENELADARERAQVDRGELSQTQAINNQYDRRIDTLEKTKGALTDLLNDLQLNNAESEKAKEITRLILDLQLKINKLTGERTSLIDENTEALRRQAYSDMGPFARGWSDYQEEELQKRMQAWRDAGMAEEDIQRRAADNRKQREVETNRFVLENATSFNEAWAALLSQRALETGNAYTAMAQTIMNAFDEIGATITDVLGDLVTNKLKSIEDYTRQFLASMNRMLMQWAMQELWKQFGSGGGGAGGGCLSGLFSWLFGGGTGAPAGYSMQGADGFELLYHGGGWVPRMHVGGLRPGEYRAILQEGEFVVSRKGVDFLDRINKGEQAGLGGWGATVINNVTNNIRALDAADVAQWAHKNRATLGNAGIAAARDRHPSRRR